MRKTIVAVIMIILLFAPAIVVAQFEGTMVVKAFKDHNGTKKESRSMKLYFSKDYFRWDQYMFGNISAGSQVFKRAGNSSIMLNTEKNKFCKATGQEWIDKKTYTGYNPFRKASVDASKTGKTKTIAGFECIEWKISYTKRPGKEPVSYTVWTTDKLGVQHSIGFGPEIFETDMVGIVWAKLYDGGLMPLGWSTKNDDGQTTIVEVTTVEKKKVDLSLFELPKNYSEVKELSELFK